jgi:hypothetical protein
VKPTGGCFIGFICHSNRKHTKEMADNGRQTLLT